MLDKLGYVFKKEKVNTPPYLILFVTDRCNARCLHCFNWHNIDKAELDSLSLDDIKNISKSLGPLMEVSLSGGEPFLRADLPEILEIFASYNKVRSFSIPTNGLLSDVIPREVKRVLEVSGGARVNINLSLDGCKDTHDDIRQMEGAFEKLLKTYDGLSLLRREYKFGLKLLTTICNKNIREIKKLMDFVIRQMPEIDFHNFEILRGTPRDSTRVLPPSITELEGIKEVLFEYWKRFNFYGDSFNSKPAYWLKRYLFEIYIRILREKKQVIPCFAGTFDLVIDASGNVYFCELLSSLGNIKKNPLTDILSSPAAETQRQDIRKKRCYCVHSCFQGKNLYLNYRLYLPFLAYFIRENIKKK